MELRFNFPSTMGEDSEWWVIGTECYIDSPVKDDGSEFITYKAAFTIQLERTGRAGTEETTVEGAGYITTRYVLHDDEQVGTVGTINRGESFQVISAIVPSGHNTIRFALYPSRASASLASSCRNLARSPS